MTYCVKNDVLAAQESGPYNMNCLKFTAVSFIANKSPFFSTCSGIATAVAKRHKFPAGLLPWCERSCTSVKEAALTLVVSLDVDANDEDEPSSCVVLCAQRRICLAANR